MSTEEPKSEGTRFEKFAEEIDKAVEKFVSSLKERDRDGVWKRIIVPIARKGPHFADIIWEELRKKGLDGNTVIASDIALPFIDFSLYDEVVIFDDAVYYGTTFMKVRKLTEEAVRRCCGTDRSCEIVSWPLVVAEEHAADLLLDEKQMVRLPKEKIPFYINSVIDMIQGRHVPYDVEIPVFSLECDNTVSEKQYMDELCRRIEAAYDVEKVDRYATHRYNRTGKKSDATHVVLLDEVFRRHSGLKPQIAKIKVIFHRDEEERITRVNFGAYCINTINDSYLDNGSALFSDEVVEKIWKCISLPRESCSESDMEWKMEYEGHYRKSLAVLANWIYSSFMAKSILESTGHFEISAFEKGISDGLLMLGGVTDERVREKLAKEFVDNTFDVFKITYASSSHEAEGYFPLYYRQGFEKEWYDEGVRYREFLKEKNEKEPSVGMLMSMEFSAMHRFIEIPSRKAGSNVFHRLLFGESVKSMAERYRLAVDYSKTLKEILPEVHRELDKRVEAGSIVPTYVLQDGAHGSQHWVRLFRPGENEDVMRDQFGRNFMFLLRETMGISDGDVFDGSYFTNRLITLDAYVKEKPKGDKKIVFRPFEPPMSYRWDENSKGLSIFLSFDDSHEEELLDYAVRCGVVQNIDENNYKLCNTSFVESLKKGNLFCEEEEQDIHNFTAAIRKVERKAFGIFGSPQKLASLYVWSADEAKKDAEEFIEILSTYSFNGNRKEAAEPKSVSNRIRNLFYKFVVYTPLTAPNRSRPEQYDGEEKEIAGGLAKKWDGMRPAIEALRPVVELFRLSYFMEARYMKWFGWQDIATFADLIPGNFPEKVRLGNREYPLCEIWTDGTLQKEFDRNPEETLVDVHHKVAQEAKAALSQMP